MADIFVSYKSEEFSKVSALVAFFERLGLSVWHDYSLASGDRYAQVITEEINLAKAVVVCWSRGATQSDWVQAEAEKARSLNKYSSVTLEECDPPIPFNFLHSANLTTWSGASNHDGIRRLVERLNAFLGAGVGAAYAALCNEENRLIAEEITTQGDEPEYPSDEPPSKASVDAQAFTAEYLKAHFAQSPYHAGSHDLLALVAQRAYEAQILRSKDTRWIVGEISDAPFDVPQHAHQTNSLSEACSKALDGETIVLLPGTYAGEFRLQRAVRIVGFGGHNLRPNITGLGRSRAVFKVSSSAQVENVVVESRARQIALHITGGKPNFVRCMVSRHELVESSLPCVWVSRGAHPTFVACSVLGESSLGIRFAGGAGGTFLGVDLTTRGADAILVNHQAKPSFHRCSVKATNGHGVVSKGQAAAFFLECSLRATQHSVILNTDESYSRFVASKISARGAGLIRIDGFARGRFERNKLEPDPEFLAEEVHREIQTPQIFGRRRTTPVRPKPIEASPHHRARFAENRLPNGTEALPFVIRN